MFIRDHIEGGDSFAVESTFRTDIAIRQATEAAARGFETHLVFTCTDDVEENIRRIAIRAHDGGHSAPPERVRQTYANSLSNLVSAMGVFAHVHLVDNTQPRIPGSIEGGPRPVATFHGGVLGSIFPPIPAWVTNAFIGTSFEGL